MKKCELCNSVARMYCESDQASLCWDCDHRVHMANFIVAKHTRTLLCHACQDPTPWTGSGSKLSPTVSVCEGCVRRRGLGNESNVGEEHDDEDEDEDEDEEEETDDDDDDGENQVVPPSLVSSSSSNGDTSSRREGGSSSSLGSINEATVDDNERFSNGSKRTGEKKLTPDVRSWRWR